MYQHGLGDLFHDLNDGLLDCCGHFRRQSHVGYQRDLDDLYRGQKNYYLIRSVNLRVFHGGYWLDLDDLIHGHQNDPLTNYKNLRRLSHVGYLYDCHEWILGHQSDSPNQYGILL